MSERDQNVVAESDLISAAFNQPGTVLLQNADAIRSEEPTLLFSHPEQNIVANTAAEVQASLLALQYAVNSGRYVAGYMTYEAGLALHGLPAHPLPAGEPLLCFGVYSQVQSSRPQAATQTPAESLNLALMPAVSRDRYCNSIETVQQWIAAGDIYQANYTMPLQSQCADSPEAIYRAILQQQPAAFASIVRLQLPGGVTPLLLSFSPELFFATDEHRSILTRPMKGTAARRDQAAADAQAAGALAADPKNRAEHIMIVDLLRNDLGRVCEVGSVHVSDLFRVQTLPTVHQMVSDVRGRLRADATWSQIIPALFPSGSITGAPKHRAMQLLHQIENAPRGVYTGAIGYFAPDGRSRFSVAIRTLTLRERNNEHEVTCGVGGGIVADSFAGDERREAMLKAAFVRRASRPNHLIETMLGNHGRVRWLETHLDRMEHSAQELGRLFDREAVRSAVTTAARQTADTPPQRIRTTLSESCELNIETRPLDTWPAELRVRMEPRRSHLGDPALMHKTNFRESYDKALNEARRDGFQEALYANDAGLVTEGCVTNLFFVRDGRLLTPRLECGVLPGILRTELLRAGLLEESLLTLAGLEECECLLLGNSLRGAYHVASLQLDPERTLTWSRDRSARYLEIINGLVCEA